MQEAQFPLEIISNILSLMVVVAIIYRVYQYKKRIDVIKQLSILKEENQLSQEDNDFIEANYQEYGIKYQKQQALIKFIYPALILITGVFFLSFDFAEAMIHLNIVVVTFLYLHIVRIHYKNYFNLLTDLKA